MSDLDEFEERPKIRWNFEPYHPVEQDRMDSIIFIKQWQKTMMPAGVIAEHGSIDPGVLLIDPHYIENEEIRFPILQMFPNFGTPTEHDTRTASNMILWLGTPKGQGFLSQAANYMAKGLKPSVAYLGAWAECNIRPPFSPYGSGVPRDILSSQFDKACYASSMRDTETLEQVALWLATGEGQAFVKKCQEQITLKNQYLREERRKATQAKIEGRIDPK